MGEAVITLPLPPTVNHVWKHTVRGRRACVYMSAEGKAYRQHVGLECNRQQVSGLKLSGRLVVRVGLAFPDRRRCDIDNRLKALFDGLTAAGVWLDDSQIDELFVARLPVSSESKAKGGYAVIDIKELAA
ncbi:crossover junction endodeoxyribonuclease RusA [Kistimonas scapharcae]|uniref:Crossover junction endodeoxyribonuclease rusA n=1 Tax=Kistimonas scapharcae TaxID=1036133 RepID=A0ABP8V733_9GAMM